MQNGSLAKNKENPRYEVTSSDIGHYIQYMKYHADIGKSMEIYASKKYILGWAKYSCKPKGHIDLKLGSKGFFNTIFFCIKDKDRRVLIES
jgi:hypothetical protein